MNKTQLLFIVILIEGYVVLATELLAIRQLVPFVGSGTETISIVISAVLLPLAVGYHAGGSAFRRHYRKHRENHRGTLSVRKLLLKNIISALIIFSIGLSYIFMELLFSALSASGITSPLVQTTIFSCLFLVYPVFLLGQTVPLVSNYFSRRKLSEITGKMLFFSTTGSFLGSVFSTIVLMTTIGVHNTVIATLGLLCVLTLLLVRKPFAYEVVLSGFVFILLFLLNGNHMMQELNVVSNNAYNMVSVEDKPEEQARIFNVNRSASSKVTEDPSQNFEYWKYLQKNVIGLLPTSGPKKDVLVLGAGGFTIGLNDTHNNYVYVDIDAALKDVAEEHFLKEKLTPNKHFAPASARVFVRNHDKLYDFILIDVFTNTISIPQESTTREFLADTKKLLKDGGVLAVNVISSPNFNELFTVRYHNTFASVFPVFSRHVVGPFNAWRTADETSAARFEGMGNVLYMYYNNELAQDKGIYTEDKNTYSFDRK